MDLGAIVDGHGGFDDVGDLLGVEHVESLHVVPFQAQLEGLLHQSVCVEHPLGAISDQIQQLLL